jgi:hypothetical protein
LSPILPEKKIVYVQALIEMIFNKTFLLQTRFANDIFIQNLCFSIGKLLFAG